MRPIMDVAKSLGLDPADVELYGNWKAKLALQSFSTRPRRGKLVLVSAITPTPAGEGKTTTSVGLAQGLAKIGVRSAVALREPSLGPLFGMKGGGAGGRGFGGVAGLGLHKDLKRGLPCRFAAHKPLLPLPRH